jgi:protein involved in polysaccharide export with SLBB domain
MNVSREAVGISAVRLIPVVLTLLALSLLSGCGRESMGPAVKREMSIAFTPEQREAVSAAENSGYLIRRGDTLEVSDLFNAVLNQQEVLVLPDGMASFFGLGPLRVAGLTMTAVDSLLTAEYGKEFRDPRLTVAMRKLGNTNVYVLGEVRQPGRYELPREGFSLLAAIAQAGGFDRGADRGSVVLLRMTQSGYLCREIDLSNLSAGVVFDPIVADLQPYDVVYVSRSAIGDFASFTSLLVTSLLQYTQLAADLKYAAEGNVFRR